VFILKYSNQEQKIWHPHHYTTETWSYRSDVRCQIHKQQIYSFKSRLVTVPKLKILDILSHTTQIPLTKTTKETEKAKF